MSEPDYDNLCDTIGGVKYDIVGDPNSYSENVSNDGKSDAVIRYICAWDDRATLSTSILTANNANVGGTLVEVGMAHPVYTQWYAMAAKSSPVSALREQAYIDVTYKPLDFTIGTPSVVREARLGINNEVIPLLSHSIQFPDGTKADRDQEFLMTYFTYKVTLKNVVSFPLSSVIACQNKVHSGTMVLQFGGNTSFISGDQVLYNGIDDIAIGYTSAGSQAFDVTHNFLIAPISLNKLYNPNSTAANVLARYQTVTPAIYQSANLGSLGV